jgi:D-galactarolactone isomerase
MSQDPRANPNSRPRLKAPPGACDTHMHFYDSKYPTAPTAFITPPDASVADYRMMQQRLGLTRTVIVQPSTYGKDNRCTLEALAELGENGRGIAVVDTSVSDGELARLTKARVCGIRFHMLKGGALPWDIIEVMVARVQNFGWHVQLQLDGRDLPDREALIRRLPGTLVIDHVGKFLEPVPVDHPSFKVLQRLVDRGQTWVKLSAAYEVSKKGPPNYDDVGALAKALVKQAPERMLWASNWPHPSAPPNDIPDDAMLLDTLLDWALDDATRRRILADNPAQLYGFGPA